MSLESKNPDPTGVPPAEADARLGERLDGWKAIAGHLGRDIRTVQRWELSEHLPVHRLEHKQRATAYAFTAELDDWMAKRVPASGDGRPTEPDPASTIDPSPASAIHVKRYFLPFAALVAFAAFVALGLWVWGRPDQRSGGDTGDSQAYSAFAEGSALYASRQYRDAAIALERAVSRDPDYGLAWAWLAKTYARLSQPMWTGGKTASDRATEAADRAARLIPGVADTHVALSLAARARGDVARWRAEAQRAIDLDPRTSEAYGLLGDSYSAYVYACNRDQNPELAETYYRRAMELRPSQSIAASNRAHNLRRMGRYAECVDLMNRTIKAFPDVTPLVAERGACRLLAGDIEGAEADLLSLRGNPKLAPAGTLVYLGLLELKTGRVEDGIRDLEAVIQQDQTARAELVVAETYGLGGEIPRAVTHLERAFSLDPTCVGAVDRGLAFAPIRQSAEVKALLARHGVR
jgi:tetratricopeptide (TPR) repeat protein